MRTSASGVAPPLAVSWCAASLDMVGPVRLSGQLSLEEIELALSTKPSDANSSTAVAAARRHRGRLRCPDGLRLWALSRNEAC